jgi:hypothetical protein
MSKDPLSVATGGSMVQRIAEGVGIVRERTIEIGSRVIWVDNIGSIVIVRGQANYALAIVGALMVLVAITQIGSNAGMALLLAAAGIGLIIFNIKQQVNNGLSIGTTDGRSTLIVSDKEQFLTETLALLCEKIDTGSITLQGTFDIGSAHVNTAGGGVVVGDRGRAVAKEERVDFDAASPGSARQPPPPQRTPTVEQNSAPPPARQSSPAAFESPRFYDEDPVESPAGRRSLPIALLVMIGAAILAAGAGFVWWNQAEIERRDWEATSRTEPAALRAYVSAHPTGRYRPGAEVALAQLEEQQYQVARASNDVRLLQTFLVQFPQSMHAEEVRSQVTRIEKEQSFRASAPAQEAPLPGTVFNMFPRQMLLQWTPMSDAIRYIVEIEIFDPSTNQWVEDPASIRTAVVDGNTYAFEFVGAQPGRWRVRGLDSEGNQSSSSEWWTFQHMR